MLLLSTFLCGRRVNRHGICKWSNVLKHMHNLVQNETENTLEQSKAFRGRANHAIYSNLFLVL